MKKNKKNKQQINYLDLIPVETGKTRLAYRPSGTGCIRSEE